MQNLQLQEQIILEHLGKIFELSSFGFQKKKNKKKFQIFC